MGAQQRRCPACQRDLTEQGKFCGYCGFRLSAISEASHEALAEQIRSAGEGLDPLPAFGGQQDLAVDDDTHADVYADTFVAGRCLDQEQAPSLSPPNRAAVASLDLPAPAALGLSPAAARADTALASPVIGSSDGQPPEAVLSPAAALPGAATAAPGANNHSGRQTSRFPIKVEVNYTSEHNFFTGVIENVSSGGIFIATEQPGAIGQEYEVSFTVPGVNKICQAICRVCWTRGTLQGRGPAGMGLRFVQLDAEARAAIELFLRHREPILFEDA